MQRIQFLVRFGAFAPIDFASAMGADRPAAEHLIRRMPAAVLAGGTGEDHGAPRAGFRALGKAVLMPQQRSVDAL